MRILSMALMLGGLLAVHSVADAQVFVSEDDRLALEAFYDRTDGALWHENEGWLGQEGSECDWYGVICGQFPEGEQTFAPVIGLYLPENNLNGALADALEGFDDLRLIALRGNNLAGDIPAWLGTFSSLQTLDLGDNPLGGTIPAELFSLPELRQLWLDQTLLQGELPAVPQPPVMLTELMLHDNQLSGEIPAWVGEVVNLALLALDNNQFEGTIPAFPWAADSWNSADRQITLSNNALNGPIPDSLAKLPHLNVLDLSNNAFDDNLDQWVRTLEPIEIEWSPIDRVGLEWLRVLNLSHNQFYGAYPAELATRPVLTKLNLSDNQLSGELPDDDLITPMRSSFMNSDFENVDLEWSLDISNNPGLSGMLPDQTALLGLFDGLEIKHEGTSVIASDCGARRLSQGFRDPASYRAPVGSVRIWVYPVPGLDLGPYQIVDSIPAGWQADVTGECFCDQDGQFVRSIEIDRDDEIRTLHRLSAPPPGSGMLESPFEGGELVFSDPDVAPMRICGDPIAFRDQVFTDGFGD